MSEVKTKKCKCGYEVVKKAKVCPECGKKFMGLGKKMLIAFGVIIVLAIFKPGSGSESTPSSSTPELTVSERAEQLAKAKADAETKAAKEKADALKISDSDKALLKKSYSTLDAQQKTQFAAIKEKYKALPNAEVKDISTDFVRLSNEEAAQQKKEAEEKAAAEAKAAYKKWIDDQFSVWDGSNRYLVNLLKENLNDPKSFEHVETKYWDRGDYLTIKMTYRAKNAFGGLILQNVTAKSDYKTDTISIISQND